MINASKKFKEKLKTGGTVVNYADVTLSDGTVLHLEPKDIMLGGCTIDDKTTDGKFGVGFVIGKTLSLRITNHDEQFSIYDFYNSIITLYVAMQLDDGTIEKIRKGVYYTTVPETPGDIIEISAADGMYRLDRDYANSGTVYPASLQTIITEACLDCGIPVGFRQFDNMSFVVQEKPEKATYRQVVSYACQIAGYNARIDNNGYMQLVWYNTALLDSKVYDGGDFLIYPHNTKLDGGDFFDYGAVKIIDGGLFTDAHPEHIFRFKNLTVHTDDVVITGVQVVYEDTDILFGENGYTIKVENNPFVAGKENSVANYLGRRMVGMYFRPFSGSVLGNPLYEPFDVCKVSDRKDNTYQSIINSVSYTVGSYTEIACQAEDPVRNGSSYYSEAAAAVVEARRNAEKQITEYDKAVQNMNQIAMNAMGYHTTFEDQPDGSRITYLHDKPNLSDSKIIYKQTIDGFFVSQDGGKSYTAGFDSQGNAVVNILYAIGIVADWIRTGRLVVRDSKNAITLLADVDTGQVIINAESVSISGKTASTQEYAKNQASSALSSAKTYADTASKEAVEEQTQLDIFNKLTNNGETQGLYIQNGKLYLNATYIATGYFSFNRGRGGTLTLGGANNSYGILRILDNDGKLCNQVSNTGMSLYNEGVLTGDIGTSKMDKRPEMKALAFRLKHGQAFMDWSYQEEEGGPGIIQFAYYSPAQSEHVVGLHAGANLFMDYNRIYFGDGYSGYITNSGDSGITFGASSNIYFYVSSSLKAHINYSEFGIYANLNLHNYNILNQSDERLKENIEQSEIPALEVINEIQTYSYDWIETGEHEDIDFIAQQMDSVVPELIYVDEETGVYSINKTGLIPYLVKAVQELTLQVQELKEEVAELKGEKIISRKKAGKKWTPKQYTDSEKAAFVEKLAKSREIKESEPTPIIEGG